MPKIPKERISWDSCIIIDAIQKEPRRYPWISSMVTKAEAGNLEIVVSTVSVSEVLYLPEMTAQGMSQEDQDDLIEKWFDNSYLIKRNADFGTCQEAAKLRRRFRVTPVDSIILATAIRAEVTTLVTYDGENGKDRGSLLALDGQLDKDGPRIARPEDYTIIPELPL